MYGALSCKHAVRAINRPFTSAAGKAEGSQMVQCTVDCGRKDPILHFRDHTRDVYARVSIA